MKSATKKKLVSFALCLIIGSAAILPTIVFGQIDPETTNYGLDDMTAIGIATGDSVTLTGVIVQVINVALGFLGVLAVIIILYAGFKWMTAAGSDEKVKDAKTMIVQALIGLVIIFMAWVIANFVIEGLMSASGVE